MSALPRVAATFLLLLASTPATADATEINPLLLRAAWRASWITAKDAPVRDPAIIHVRKLLELASVPGKFVVHVSADNRFILHVNGRRVGAGPARGDVEHWRFQTFDLAPFLVPGKNLIAATVWNFGALAPFAQMTRQLGFILQGDDDAASAANSNDSWQAAIARGHAASPAGLVPIRRFFYAAGPPERRDGTQWDWDWDRIQSPAARWAPAAGAGHGTPRTIRDGAPYALSPSAWLLVPDPLPAMEETITEVGRVVRQTGPVAITGAFPAEGRAVIPARSTARVLLDRGTITNAYPEIALSGGRGATVRMHYAESLFGKDGKKGNRDEIANKDVIGLYDEWVTDGNDRVFAPLWWRSWRYLELEVTTAGTPLTITRLSALQTLYPFAPRARFASSDPELARLWQMAFATLRISAWETYMDSPYWEQLQYVGDTRITALLSYVMANDDRLARQALTAFDDSRTADGLTMSRYPTREQQYIPPYALFWIGMVHDFFYYRDDPEFVRARLPGTRTVLDWFLRNQRPDGLLGFSAWWSHVDPAAGGARQTEQGGSAAVTAQLIAGLREAAELETALGDQARAATYRTAAARAVRALAGLWDDKAGLLRDHPGATEFSHDVNILALWQDVLSGPRRDRLRDRVLALGREPPGRRAAPGTIAPASLYFRYYLHRALDHVGHGEALHELLFPWRQMLGMGLSTFPEFSDPTRSDSHAWTAHPALDFLAIIAGIRPAAPGFARVRITPHLGTLTQLTAALPHPRGEIVTQYQRDGARTTATISLPARLPGSLLWKGRRHALPPGKTTTLTLD